MIDYLLNVILLDGDPIHIFNPAVANSASAVLLDGFHSFPSPIPIFLFVRHTPQHEI